MKTKQDIEAWAQIRETSVEVAEAIFEKAEDDEVLAEQIWEEGNDGVLVNAFAKTDADHLFWGTETVERKNL